MSIAKGLDSIKSQFNGMPKLFAESVTEKCDLLASSTASRIELNLTQRYVFKSPIPFKEKGTVKPVNSKVTFHLNGAGLIEKHDEEYVLTLVSCFSLIPVIIQSTQRAAHVTGALV